MSSRKRTHRVTYNRLFAKQEGRCAICRGKSRRRLQVDHDHRTKQVRRLLCGPCNKGLDLFRDDVRLVRRAAAYLAAALKRKPRRRAKRPREKRR
jgi:Recombination endonuclease VII